MRKRFVCGLDIGTYKTCAACGTVDSSGKMDILATQSVRTCGLEAGRIIDSKKVTACIKDVIRNLYRVQRLRVRRVYANIDNPDLTSKVCEKEVFFKQKTLLNKSHIFKLIDSCITSQTSLNREIIHMGLRNFILDNQTDCIYPEGYVTRQLKLDIVVISALIPTIKSLIKCIRGAGLIVEGLIPSGCAQALSLFRDNKSGFKKYDFLIDVGGGLSKLYILKDRLVKELVVLPLGSQNITEDISIKLKVSFDCAEELKTKYGQVHYENKSLAQKVIVKDKLIDKVVYLTHLSEIIAQRVDWLLHQIRKALLGLAYRDEEIGEIVVTGGGSVLEGFLERADKILGRPVKMGFLPDVKDNYIQANSSFYATSIGLIHFASEAQVSLNSFTRLRFIPFMRMLNWTKELYQEYF